MRYLFTTLCLILLVGLMLVTGDGLAQIFDNEIGLYTDLSADPASTSINVVPNVPFNIYLLLSNPLQVEATPFGWEVPVTVEMTHVTAVQYQMLMPETGLYTLADIPNGEGIRFISPPDFLVTYDVPIPVPHNGAVLLVTFTFMTTDADPKVFYLKPTVAFGRDQLAIAGLSEYFPDGGPDQDVYPVSGDYDNPVFGINTGVVAIQNESWGNVKALYR